MANETLEELRYNGKKVIAEVARRDILGKEIPKQYLPQELIPIDFRAEVLISNPYESRTVSANFSDLVNAANKLYYGMLNTSESYTIHAHIIFQNLATDGSYTSIFINGMSVFYASGDWYNIEVDIYENDTDLYPEIKALIKIYNNQAIRTTVNNIPINSNTLQIKISTTHNSSGLTNAHVCMSCRCSVERTVSITA